MKVLLTSVPQAAPAILPGRLRPFHKLLDLLGGGRPILGLQPPYGLLYLASSLERAGHSALVFDGLLSTEAQILAAVRVERPGVAGISCVSSNWAGARRLAEEIKKIAPGVKVALGGPHINAVREQALHECPHADYAFYGDGEETFSAVVSALGAGRPAPPGLDGVACRDGDRIAAAPESAVIKEIDGIPFPAREALGLKNYRPSPLYYRELPYAAVFGARGCPHRCTFCHTEPAARLRSPENLLAEVVSLRRDHGVREIMFYDDNFTLDRRRTARFCELLLARKVSLSWSASVRADSVDAATLRLMKAAGCWKLALGVESGCQRLLDRMKKDESLEQIERAVNLINVSGIQTAGFFMFGQPTETFEEGLETIAFMKKLRLDFVNVTALTPFPGTEVYDEVSGQPGFKGLEAMNMFDIAYVPDTLTEERLRFLINSAFRQFYFRPAYILRQLRRLRSPGDLLRYARGFAVAALAAFAGDGGDKKA
jgi:radical SAM superfamily enzyme YgiQ (UPF0313 family)